MGPAATPRSDGGVTRPAVSATVAGTQVQEPMATTSRARWAEVTTTNGLLPTGAAGSPRGRRDGSTGSAEGRCGSLHVARAAAAGDALEQDQPVARRLDRESAARPSGRRRGRSFPPSVAAGERQVGAERPALGRPADGPRRSAAGEIAERVAAALHVQPDHPRPARRWDRAGAADHDLDRRRPPRPPRPRQRLRHPLVRCRAEEAERDVEPVEADPADLGRGPSSSSRIRATTSAAAARRLGQRHRDEQARSAPTVARSGGRPAAGVRRAWSGPSEHLERPVALPPADDVDALSSSSLYVWKKCSISTRRWGRTCSRRSTWAWWGSPTATHRTLKSKPFSSRISRPPIGRAQTRQPGNVGSSISRSASVWSPSPARVSMTKP